MYLARTGDKAEDLFKVRQSYCMDGIWYSRDLGDLGPDPGRFIVYPGGNAFYPDPGLVDRIGHRLQQHGQTQIGNVAERIESLLWAFVKPEIRRAVGSFYRRSKPPQEDLLGSDLEAIRALPIFDRRRLLFLRTGQMDQTRIHRAPPKLFRVLLKKSRDEIEHMMLAQERNLKGRDIKSYVFVIFNLHQFFQSPMAKAFPQVLPPEKVDICFLDQLCRLNQKTDLWQGLPETDGLQHYLRRYAIMYFDFRYPEEDFDRGYVDDFRRRHRFFRRVQPALNIKPREYRRLFGHDRRTLRTMEKKQLRRLYRKMAIRHHPDQGGQPQTFIRLSQLYHNLLKNMS